MLIERLLWQKSEYKTQRSQLWKCRKIWDMLKWRDQQPESPNNHLGRYWTLLVTIWVILHIWTMRMMWKTTQTMEMIQIWASWQNMMNLAVGWAQSPKQWATHVEFLAEVDEDWWVDPTGMGGCCRLLPWERYVVQNDQIDGSSSCQASNRHNCSHTNADNIWRADADTCYHPRTIGNAARHFWNNK